jgi:hypothetical protein
MNVYDLKSKVSATGSYFFTPDSMKFFGDTISNYGVKQTTVEIDCKSVEVYELRRKRPVKNGLRSSAYFDVTTFDRVFPDRD